MNYLEKDIWTKYIYGELTYIAIVYLEFECRTNHGKEEFEGLKTGECRFDYESWERRLRLSHKKMVKAIKTLIDESAIIQTFKGIRGTSSKYFLTRYFEVFEEQKKEQKTSRNRNRKTLVIPMDSEIRGTQKEQKEEQQTIHSSKYNNINNISIYNDQNEFAQENNSISKKAGTTNKTKVSNSDCMEVWSLYPKKRDKIEAMKHIPKYIKEYGIEQTKRAVIRYADEVKGKEDQFILYGGRFFKKRGNKLNIKDTVTEIKRLLPAEMVKDRIIQDLGLQFKNKHCICIYNHEKNPSMSFHEETKNSSALVVGTHMTYLIITWIIII